MPFDSLSVLVVRGGAVCLPMPPSWFSAPFVCFIDWVPLIDKIIWYLSFTAWLISVSVMLSSTIHAVVEGRSSFLLSVV